MVGEREQLSKVSTTVQNIAAPKPRRHGIVREEAHNSPTLTLVRASSSDALLPPPTLLLTLIRLLLRGVGRTMALIGRWGRFPGEAGGELAMAAGKGVRGAA